MKRLLSLRSLCCCALVSLTASPACDWDFERMIDQPNLRAYERTTLFDDGTSMQQPPEGTVPFLSARDPELTQVSDATGRALAAEPVVVGRGQKKPGTVILLAVALGGGAVAVLWRFL